MSVFFNNDHPMKGAKMGNEEQKPIMPPIGEYSGAKLVNYGMTKTKAGEPAPTMAFRVKLEDGKTYVTFWRGSFKGGAREFTIKALLICGLTDVRRLAKLADGPDSKLLDMDADYRVVVDHELAQDGSGKKYPRVQWVNADSGAKFKNAIDAGEAAMLIQGMGLEADFFEIAAKTGYKIGGATQKKPSPTNTSASGSKPAMNDEPPPPGDKEIPF